ncbi:protein CC2D2B [Thamnophis elegans]|uniref:protein CC2D2B n=1 Tax=Thamnophis elegans TaxID=35005 RepID=UPI0013766695|nr:protein CC2D2B [Thamnophis elegans]
MDSDEDLEALVDKKSEKEKVQERLAKKKNSLPKESIRNQQTEDNLYDERIQIEAQEQTPQKVVAEVEEQDTLTEALRDRVKEKLKTVKNEVPLDVGFEFFTSTFEEHSNVKELDTNVGQKSTDGCLQNICSLNEQTPLLVHEKEMLTELLEIKSPACNFNKVDKEKAWNQLFIPSTSPVTHSCKLPINMSPRLLEEEGFYIPRKPYIPRNMYHKMENRLQREGAKGWFEESGEIISLPSPVKQSSHRVVSFPVKTVTELKTIYKKLKALISATKLAETNLKTGRLNTNTIKDYKSQIRNTKILYDKEQQRDYSLIQNMLKGWKQMKTLRRQQSFTSTTIKIQFQRQMHNSELDEYLAKISEDDEKEDSLDSVCTSQSLTDLKEGKKTFFVPHMTFISEITPAKLCPLEEQNRREKVKMEKYFIKIYYNNKLVSCTPEFSLCDDFKVIFQQHFIIQILNWSESLQLEIMESNKNMLLAKVYLPLPNNCILKSKDVLDEVEFSCEQQVKPSDGAVGSNVPFSFGENQTEELCIMTSGKLIYSLSWTVNDKEIHLAPTIQHAFISSNSVPRNISSGKGTGIWWHSDIQKLIDWAKDINIDPNDPYYSDLFELIMYAQSQEKSDSKHFRLKLLQEFNLAIEEHIENCKRFRLLQLRNLGQLGFYCFQQIPLFDKEIPDTIFQEHGGQLEKDMFMTDMDPISAQRNSSANFVRMMRNQVAKQILTIRHKFNLSDLVSDYEEIISMSQLSNAIFKLSERRRHLKPQRKERRKVAAQGVSDGDVKLLIRILRAYNIPARKAPTSKVAVTYSPSYLPNCISRGRHIALGNSAYAGDLLSEVTVHPFVEVTFQKTVYQTSTADGSHPCWNEELQVDFNSPARDYTFLGLSKIKDNINISIFDEFVIEKHEDACPNSCSGHSYIRKNWLGSIVFPFSALLEQSKICGTFQIDMPPVVLGYTWSKTYVPPKEECFGQNLKEYSFLTIFATIEPQLSSTENNLDLDTFADHEAETPLQRAYIFKQTWKAVFPKRRIMTSVFNNQGRNILVTKYISPLNPPQLLLDMYPKDPNSTSDLISRFVSLIPCIADTVDENNDVDVWMTSEHCIELGVGNKEEHAVLLCNYLLYIGKKAWVLLGTSVLEGKVAYVATQENGEYFLWNPLSGHCYKQFDAFCPLQSVDCLISWENVWFNIQQNNSPMCTSFDISKESFWKQLLPYNFQNSKTQTVQPEKIFYVATDGSLVDELQNSIVTIMMINILVVFFLKNRIEKTLKNKIMEWRSHLPTRWHRQCTSVLRQILPKLELRNGHITKEKEGSYLEAFQEHYWVTGFPLQMPYLDIPSITEAVYQTGIHSSEIPYTEFALAVYVHPYPNKILSVWIYLVSLVCHQ